MDKTLFVIDMWGGLKSLGIAYVKGGTHPNFLLTQAGMRYRLLPAYTNCTKLQHIAEPILIETHCRTARQLPCVSIHYQYYVPSMPVRNAALQFRAG